MRVRSFYLIMLMVGLLFSGATLTSAVPDKKGSDSSSIVKVDVGKSANIVAEKSSSVQGMSWEEVIKNGGWLMYVLCAVSILALSLVLYFSVVMRVSQVAPLALQHELMEKIKAGDLDDARRICEYGSYPLSSVVLAAMNYMRDASEVDPVMLRDVVEGEGSRQADAIQGPAQYLMDVAVVSPMIGLLGTVFGMLKAFSSVALDIAQAKPVVLAHGVSQALITTAFGLIVGIPAMMFYSYFRRRASRLVSYLESATTDVLTALYNRDAS